MSEIVSIQELGLQAYEPVWQALKQFTLARDQKTIDQIWLLEHLPVFTQGQAGKAEHLINPGAIPVVQSDRGGQVTYHGPGQLIVYLLTDIARKGLNIKQFVCLIESSILELLKKYAITAHLQTGAPGVYVNNAKICSIGLRVRHGRTYHGLSLNVNMDLAPFARINPCGYTGLQVTQISELGGPQNIAQVSKDLLPELLQRIGYSQKHLGKYT